MGCPYIFLSQGTLLKLKVLNAFTWALLKQGIEFVLIIALTDTQQLQRLQIHSRCENQAIYLRIHM